MIWHGPRRLKAGTLRHRLRRLRPDPSRSVPGGLLIGSMPWFTRIAMGCSSGCNCIEDAEEASHARDERNLGRPRSIRLL